MSNPVVSAVGICNSALLKVGAQTISSFSDGTRASTICSTLYYVLRDEVMGAAPWRFAYTLVTLGVPLANAPAFKYQAAYQLPSDCLRPLTVNVDDWTLSGSQILCDKTDGINLSYIQRNCNESQWDARFAEALAWRLAVELALALVQSMPVKQEMEKSYNAAIAQARSINAVQGTPPHLIADIWSGARKGYQFYWPVDAGAPENYGP